MTKIKHYPPITIGFFIVIAMLAGIQFLLESSNPTLKIVILSSLIAVCGIFIVSILVQIKKTKARGEIEKDEFTHKVRLHAGNTSFFYSIYLWLLLYLLKDYLMETTNILGFGIVGSGALYFISIAYFAKSANFGSR